MKNLILTTVSALALSAFAAQAAPKNNMNDKSLQTESQSSSMATDGAQPMMEKGSSSSAEATAPSSGSSSAPSQMKKSMGQHHGVPHAKHRGHHPKHHVKHHARMGHPQYPNQAEIGGVFVTFPPMNLGESWRPELYAGRTECPYAYHEGYFWYPHTNAAMLRGYTPSLLRGMYWYPSYMHPYAVYTQRAPITYTVPYVLSRPLPSDSAMYNAQTAPMRKKWESAPEERPGQLK